jgi:hypothetical protein
MKTPSRILSLIAALVALPLSWASATTSLEFNNNPNNMVGGTLDTINVTGGGSFTLSLQINSTVPTNAVDYWLSQFSGPGGNPFTITGRDYTLSLYPDPSTANGPSTTAAGDNWSNTTGAPFVTDGIQDNLISPRNGPDLGSTKATAGDNAAGTNQIATFTISVAGGATAGLYQLRSFDYTGLGWSSTTLTDQAFDNQAAINVNVAVPEPSTWAMSVLGVGVIGYTMLRRRRVA